MRYNFIGDNTNRSDTQGVGAPENIYSFTAWKVSKYGVFSGPYFHIFVLNTEICVFSTNAEKYGPEKTPYLDAFHAVFI